MNLAPRIPSVGELLWPTLRAVREIGDSGTIEEIVEKAIELEGFTEEQQAVLHGEGPRTKIEYRLAWARSYLKGMGALDNSERGVWSTTEVGRSMTPADVVSRHAAYVASLREARKAKQLARAEQDDELEEESARRDWKERLLEVLFEVPPDGFERLARRLLREAGFVSATVTGKSGDGGIDGTPHLSGWGPGGRRFKSCLPDFVPGALSSPPKTSRTSEIWLQRRGCRPDRLKRRDALKSRGESVPHTKPHTKCATDRTRARLFLYEHRSTR